MKEVVSQNVTKSSPTTMIPPLTKKIIDKFFTTPDNIAKVACSKKLMENPNIILDSLHSSDNIQTIINCVDILLDDKNIETKISALNLLRIKIQDIYLKKLSLEDTKKLISDALIYDVIDKNSYLATQLHREKDDNTLKYLVNRIKALNNNADNQFELSILLYTISPKQNISKLSSPEYKNFIPHLISLINSPITNIAIKDSIIELLGLMKAEVAIPTILSIYTDTSSHPTSKISCITTFMRLNYVDVAPILLQYVQNYFNPPPTADTNSYDMSIALKCIEALGRFKMENLDDKVYLLKYMSLIFQYHYDFIKSSSSPLSLSSDESYLDSCFDDCIHFVIFSSAALSDLNNNLSSPGRPYYKHNIANLIYEALSLSLSHPCTYSLCDEGHVKGLSYLNTKKSKIFLENLLKDIKYPSKLRQSALIALVKCRSFDINENLHLIMKYINEFLVGSVDHTIIQEYTAESIVKALGRLETRLELSRSFNVINPFALNVHQKIMQSLDNLSFESYQQMSITAKLTTLNSLYENVILLHKHLQDFQDKTFSEYKINKFLKSIYKKLVTKTYLFDEQQIPDLKGFETILDIIKIAIDRQQKEMPSYEKSTPLKPDTSTVTIQM